MGSRDRDRDLETADSEEEKEKGMSQTEYDLCCFLIPLWVFGLPLLLSGIMTYFFWDHEEAHTIGLMLIGISCMCLSMGTVLMIVYFICVGGKRRTTTTIIVHRREDELGTSGEDYVPQLPLPRYDPPPLPHTSDEVSVYNLGYSSGEKAPVRASIREPTTPGQVIPKW